MTRPPASERSGLSEREIRLFTLVIPIACSIFAAGASYAGVRLALDSKVDKQTFAIHLQQGELRYQSLQTKDSLILNQVQENRLRIQEIVCQAIKGCR